MDRVIGSRRVVLPDGMCPASIEIGNGIIAGVGPYEATHGEDYGDLVIIPGLVDTHVHINEPGRAEWEGFATATRAAAAGGVTTLIEMPLTSIPATGLSGSAGNEGGGGAGAVLGGCRFLGRGDSGQYGRAAAIMGGGLLRLQVLPRAVGCG